MFACAIEMSDRLILYCIGYEPSHFMVYVIVVA